MSEYLQIVDSKVEKRCGSVDIRNDPYRSFKNIHSKATLALYKECTVLEGDFGMSMIMGKNLTDDDFPVFENIKEITGSILIYQVNGLTSLGKMFPNLRIIGGHSLIMNYALVI